MTSSGFFLCTYMYMYIFIMHIIIMILAILGYKLDLSSLERPLPHPPTVCQTGSGEGSNFTLSKCFEPRIGGTIPYGNGGFP